jgi:hypothetical protein
MNKSALILMVAISGAFAAAIADAQVSPREKIAPTEQVTLEKRVALLEAQNAELRKFILINGDALTIKAVDSLTVEGGKGITVRAGAGLSVRSGQDTSLEAAGGMNVKGNMVNLRGGGTTANGVARTGDQVQVMMNGSLYYGKLVSASSRVTAD